MTTLKVIVELAMIWVFFATQTWFFETTMNWNSAAIAGATWFVELLIALAVLLSTSIWLWS